MKEIWFNRDSKSWYENGILNSQHTLDSKGLDPIFSMIFNDESKLEYLRITGEYQFDLAHFKDVNVSKNLILRRRNK